MYNHQKLKIESSDFKGSFTCLGLKYNVLSNESMDKCKDMLTWDVVTPSDKITAKKEIRLAKQDLKNWKRKSHLYWLYEELEKQENTLIYTTED